MSRSRSSTSSSPDETLPRPALEDVRRRVITERDARRTWMLKRLDHVNLSKLDRRLGAIGEVLVETGSEAWRDALGARLLKRSKALAAAMAAAGHLQRARATAQGAHRGKEASLCDGAPLRIPA